MWSKSESTTKTSVGLLLWFFFFLLLSRPHLLHHARKMVEKTQHKSCIVGSDADAAWNRYLLLRVGSGSLAVWEPAVKRRCKQRLFFFCWWIIYVLQRCSCFMYWPHYICTTSLTGGLEQTMRLRRIKSKPQFHFCLWCIFSTCVFQTHNMESDWIADTPQKILQSICNENCLRVHCIR